jgi:hypothetical protein
MATPPTTPSPSLTVEAIIAVEAPREFRLHPRDRRLTAEIAGARQLFTLGLRGDTTQLTASEKPTRSAVVARRSPPGLRPYERRS